MTLTEKAARLIELREKATQGEWGWMFIGGPLNPKRIDISTVGREGMHHIQIARDRDYDHLFGERDDQFIAHSANHSAQIAQAFIIAENGLNKILNHKAIGQVSDQDFILQLRGIVRDALKEIEAIK